jgi:hypothetical protein
MKRVFPLLFILLIFSITLLGKSTTSTNCYTPVQITSGTSISATIPAGNTYYYALTVNNDNSSINVDLTSQKTSLTGSILTGCNSTVLASGSANTPFSTSKKLTAETTYLIKVQNTASSGTIAYTLTPQVTVYNADDMCYGGQKISAVNLLNIINIGGKTSTPIQNLSSSPLENTQVFLNSSTLLNVLTACSVDDGPKDTNCSMQSVLQLGSLLGLSSKGTSFNLGTVSHDSNRSIQTYSTVSTGSIINIINQLLFGAPDDTSLYATYTRNGIQYAGTVAACANNGHATNYGAFQIIYGGSGNNIYGDYKTVSSSVECAQDKNGNCNWNYDGTLYNTNTKFLNSVSTSTIPLNSSTKTLTLPNDINGSDIIFAGLYWQGHIAGTKAADYFSDSKISKEGEIDFMDPNGAIHHITADKLWYLNFWGDGTGGKGGYRSFYQGYANITSLVQHSFTSNINTFSVGNIKASEGIDTPQYLWFNKSYNDYYFGFWANWTLVVVYQYPNPNSMNPEPKPKNITIFQGFQPLLPIGKSGTTLTTSIQLNLNGFLTPAQTPINANMFFYGGGGDRKLRYDSLQIQDPNDSSNYLSISNSLNPINNAFNDSVTDVNDTTNTNFDNIYYPGLDADSFNISDDIGIQQTSTILKLSSQFKVNNFDQFFPGLVIFATDLYKPQFCYDYAYSQNGVYFTEDNNGTQNPVLYGIGKNITPNTPIKMKIYLNSLVPSDLTVSDVNLSIIDINTSQVRYEPNSTELTPPNSITTQSVSPATQSSSDVTGISVGNMPSQSHLYLYYELNPLISDLNTSINVVAHYTITYGTTTIPYTLYLGKDIPMCTSGFTYNPPPGIFNIVDNRFTGSNTEGGYYNNLPTQVVSRPGNFKILSLDSTDYNTPTKRSVAVAVEMIDAGGFHDINASCGEQSSAVSPRVWVLFNDSNNELFNNTAIENAISNGMTTLSSDTALYDKALRNAAFRISYNADTNGSIIGITRLDSNSYKLTNFPKGVQEYSFCNPSYDNGNGNTITVASKCGNDGQGAGKNGMTKAQLTECMECIYGIDTKSICSRDNFSVRPAAFNITLKDQNQTNPSQKSGSLTSARTGVASPSNASLDLAAGYQYDLNITATNSQNNNAASGYYTTLSNLLDQNASYLWNPGSHTVSGCNDTSNQTFSLSFTNGTVDTNTSIDQVGIYKLHIVDANWTTVDQTTHSGSSNFIHNYDCIQNNATVQPKNGSESNGCDISSDATNSDANLQYRDINTIFHPYWFKMSGITPSIGIQYSINFTHPFVYMSDMSQSNDENMSFHLKGDIQALGEDNKTISNFVSACYAVPLDLSLTKTDYNATQATLPFQYRFNDLNSSDDPISTANGDINNTQGPIYVSEGNFTKTSHGTLNTNLNLNFNRSTAQPIDPQQITFIQYQANCHNSSDCTFNADLSSTKKTTGSLDINKTTTQHLSINFYYGRTNTPPQQYSGDRGTAPIYFEVYCNKNGNRSLLPDGTDTNQSVDSINWYQNPYHDTANDGNIRNIYEENAANVSQTALSDTNVTLRYNKTQGYPYSTTLDVNASHWLIYNPYNSAATLNTFNAKFISDGSQWTGVNANDTNISSTDANASKVTNTRVLW